MSARLESSIYGPVYHHRCSSIRSIDAAGLPLLRAFKPFQRRPANSNSIYIIVISEGAKSLKFLVFLVSVLRRDWLLREESQQFTARSSKATDKQKKPADVKSSIKQSFLLETSNFFMDFCMDCDVA